MANHNTGGITAPRPQHMERILGDAQNGHGLWLEQAPLMKLTHPCQCNCCSGNNMLLQPLPTAAELAAALAPDDSALRWQLREVERRAAAEEEPQELFFRLPSSTT